MITFTSDDGRIGYAMFISEPFNTVVGVVQCRDCDLCFPIVCNHTEWPSCTDDHVEEINVHFNDVTKHGEGCKPIVRKQRRQTRRRPLRPRH